MKDYGCNISKQAIDKRFNSSATDFLNNIFTEYLNKYIKPATIKTEWEKKFTSIRIMDSTEFKISENHCESYPGSNGNGTKACAQIQFEYDLFNGKIENISLESALTSDTTYSLTHMESLMPGSLVIRDLGYFNVNAYKKLDTKNVNYISRLKPQIHIYELKGNKYCILSHASIIKRLRKSQKPYLDIDVYIGRETLHPVRLIASLLDKDGVEKRKRKVRQKRKIFNKYDRYLNHLNLFVSNIEKSKVTSKEIYSLYKLRWQIEIIFKGWKSVFKINAIRKMSLNRLKCYLISKLIWILFSWDIYNSVRSKIWKDHRIPTSIYKCFALVKLELVTLKKIFMKCKTKIQVWISSMYDVILRYGLKEQRKGRAVVEELLDLEL